jgi:hypothetical protein
MRHVLLLCLFLTLIGGCGNPFNFDPATTVILKLSGVDDDEKKERIGEEAKELVLEKSTWHMMQTFEHNDTVMIKVSPVEDVHEYADRITFGKITSVEGNTVYVEIP